VLHLNAARSGSDGDRPGYGPHSLLRGSSMQEDLVMLIAQAVEKAIQPLQDFIPGGHDSLLEGDDCGSWGHAGHTLV
jgi:hypothetical protein